MYKKIFEFCKVRNFGNVYKNNHNPTPRVDFILKLLKSEGIDFELDRFKSSGINCYNIILRGNSDKMVVAHHDVNNHLIDNANDNSASVINAIQLKKLYPDINVAILDGEEFGGFGSTRLSQMINSNKFGYIKWVLNLELTGRGGKNFFIGDYRGPLFDHIVSKFNPPVFKTPFNDSVVFRKNGIDSLVINPLPISIIKTDLKYGENYLDPSILNNCHTDRDSIQSISISDMKEFVEEVLLKIIA
jgi:hypothetical protein